MANYLLLQASQSYFQSERDRCLSELDVYLNKNGISINPDTTTRVIELFERLAHVELTIGIVQDVIDKSNEGSPELTQLINETQNIMNQMSNPISEEKINESPESTNNQEVI